MKLIFGFLVLLLMTCNKRIQTQPGDPQAGAVSPKINGIYWMIAFPPHMEDNTQKFQTYINNIQRVLSADATLSGILLYIHWSIMEPQNGVYNQDVLKKIDAVVQTARNNHKKYKIILVCGRKTPQYVYDAGADNITTVVANPNNQEYGDTVRIPVPWDEIYLKNYYRNINYLAKKYNADTNFVATSIAVATSYSPEWMIVHNADERALWDAYPDKVQQLSLLYRNAIDSFARIYPDKQISIEASSFPFPDMVNESRSILQFGCDKLHKGFSVQINQLQGNIDMIKALSYQNVYLFKDQMHAGMQNLASWQWPETSERQGSMEMTVYNYIQSGAKYFELWDADGANAATVKKLHDMIEYANGKGLSAYKDELIQKGLYRNPTN